MRKPRAKDGVGQLVLQIAFPEEASNAAGETQAHGPVASSAPVTPRRKKERKGKWYSLYDKVYALSTLTAAWRRVKENAGAAGIDRTTVKCFDENADARLEHLAVDLRAKTYRPQPVRRVFIPKSGGGKRPLGIPTIRDRVVQTAVVLLLEPIFDAHFLDCSYGFRPNRSAHGAIEEVQANLRAGYTEVYDADQQGYFDSIPHEKLMKGLETRIADGSMLRLIRLFLRVPVQEGKGPQPSSSPRGMIRDRFEPHAISLASARRERL